MKTPHSFTPHRLAAAVVLALSGPSALAATNCTVSVATDNGQGDTPNTLSWAILTANTTTTTATGHAGGGCTNNTITLATDVSLTGVMLRLIDSDMTLDGQGHTIDGGGFRPLFVKSGTVTIKNMTISNGLAQGGTTKAGGGGAGLGGALFIYDGAVIVENVSFSSNKALGGLADITSTISFSGGGGMFGNSARGGGGLFGDSDLNGTFNIGGYGGTGAYSSTDPSFGHGGNASYTGHTSTVGGFGGGGGAGGGAGADGGFGGGGGASGVSRGGGADGGFGGGGAGGDAVAGRGGYGGGDGTTNLTSSIGGGGGAGFGGAIFAKKGMLTLKNVDFDGNDATGGTGVNSGEGRGGAVFICTANLTDSTTNQAPTGCSASINEIDSCGVTFQNDTASTGQPELFWKDLNDTYLDFNAIGATQACPVTPTGPTSPIPTLSEWGLLMMSSLLGLFGAWRTRKIAGIRTKRRT